DTVLRQKIQEIREFSRGVQALGVRVHLLPTHPRDVADEPAMHYAVLAPEAASEAGHPSSYARRFVNHHTGEDKPRVYRNSVIYVVPSESGLAAARNQVRDALAWKEVRAMKDFQGASPLRVQQVTDRLRVA